MGTMSGKVAVITGAGGGLGRDYALLFAREGAQVVVNDFSLSFDGQATSVGSTAAEVVREIIAGGGQAIAIEADVSVESGAEAILQAALGAFGKVDILINNAGYIRNAFFEDMSATDWDGVLGVHLRGTYLVTRAIWRQMIAQGSGGVVINTTSRSGLRGKAMQSNYSAAKGGIVGLSNTLALEGQRHGIRVWTISPRAFTRGWEQIDVTSAGPVTNEVRRRFSSQAVATTVLWMASDSAAAHTGKIVFASADSIREVRLAAATQHRPSAEPTLDEIVAAVADGQLLFADTPEEDVIV